MPISCSYVPGSVPAQVNCVVSFSEPYTDITWTATNGTPATATNSSKSFTTYRDGSSGTVTVRARVCYFTSCTTSADAVVSPP